MGSFCLVFGLVSSYDSKVSVPCPFIDAEAACDQDLFSKSPTEALRGVISYFDVFFQCFVFNPLLSLLVSSGIFPGFSIRNRCIF